MLVWRLSLGAVLIAAVAALCRLEAGAATPGVWLFPLALAAAVGASGEMLRLAAARDLRPPAGIVYAGNALIVAANWAPHLLGNRRDPLGAFGWPAAVLAVAVLAAFLAEMRRYEKPGHVAEQLAATVLSLCYVGLLMSFVVQLRFVDGPRYGIPALLSLVMTVKMGDTGAYTVGRLIGRHKMAPVLSPGKTIEGAIGGLAFACLGSWLTFCWLTPALVTGPVRAAPAWGWLAFGLIVGLAGMAGDLAESLLKRDLGQKDSSAWMPGFGGVLDVLDSILFAAPLAYLGWVSGLV